MRMMNGIAMAIDGYGSLNVYSYVDHHLFRIKFVRIKWINITNMDVEAITDVSWHQRFIGELKCSLIFFFICNKEIKKNICACILNKPLHSIVKSLHIYFKINYQDKCAITFYFMISLNYHIWLISFSWIFLHRIDMNYNCKIKLKRTK